MKDGRGQLRISVISLEGTMSIIFRMSGRGHIIGRRNSNLMDSNIDGMG